MMLHSPRICVFLTAVLLVILPLSNANQEDDDIDKLNNHPNNKGRVYHKKNELSGLSLSEKKKRTGLITGPLAARLENAPHLDSIPEIQKTERLKRAASPTIPANFDARTNWPNCQTVQEIRDQGSCGSCYAHAAASSISDRICIASGSAHTYFHASTQNLIICNGEYTSPYNGCNGDQIQTPFVQYVERGVVTGGNYNNNSGCMPYTSYSSTAAAATTTSSCNMACTNTAYGKTYQQDLAYASTYYGLGNTYATNAGGAAGTLTNQSVITQIQYELMTNGPMSVGVTVYNDFMSYSSGVYRNLTSTVVGGHAMKLIGWGHNTTTGDDYWIVANSWNVYWGMQGFAYILRGVNEMGIEDSLVAALPQPVGVQSAPAIPACGNTSASIVFCQGKSRYALYAESVCSSLFCVCPGNLFTNNVPNKYPMPFNCGSGTYFDPTPNNYGACGAANTIPACAGGTQPTTQPTTTAKPVANVCLSQNYVYTVNCPSGTVTSIQSALWGTTCGSSNASCNAVNVTAALIRQCTPANVSCAMTTTNAALGVATDPCPNVSKSLAVFMSCVAVSTATTTTSSPTTTKAISVTTATPTTKSPTTSAPAPTTCLPGNYVGTFSCSNGSVVSISSAFFGTSCGTATPGCVASNVTASVIQQCTPAAQSCKITSANNYYTPDPCPNVVKSLALWWGCVWASAG